MARWRRRRPWQSISRLEDVLGDDALLDADWLEEGSDAAASAAPAAAGPRPDWRDHIAAVAASMQSSAVPPDRWPAGREIIYVIDPNPPQGRQALVVSVLRRDRRSTGAWGKPTMLRLRWNEAAAVPDQTDRTILSLLAASADEYGSWPAYRGGWEAMHTRHRIPPPLQVLVMPLLRRTGRCWLAEEGSDEHVPLDWDDGEPWTFRLDVSREDGGDYLVGGALHRRNERIDVSTPRLVLHGGYVLIHERFARFDHGGALAWIAHLGQHRRIGVPASEGLALVETLLRQARAPAIDLPADLRYEEIRVPPRARLHVSAGDRELGFDAVKGVVSFAYDDAVVAASAPERGIFQPDRRRLVLRDPDREREALARLGTLGFRPPLAADVARGDPALTLAARHLPRAVAVLLDEGWHVEAEGRLYRSAGAVRMDVRSGVDWFDLHATVEFGDTVAPLPALLAALRRGERTVLLGDGTYGVLPEDWLARYGGLAALGTPDQDRLRFSRVQVGVLDALLGAQPEATCDRAFTQARAELRTFDGIRPAETPPGFVGVLRRYQREGLGWLHFLRRFGFGGCLADDMGLGKTIQVLALLESRRAEHAAAGTARVAAGTERAARPTLVVVPRSLVFNWRQEAARFTPALRILDHTGAERARSIEALAGSHVVLTTYGTLRRDAPWLKDLRFDYVILDEAQAIKNAETDTAKAARLLTADHRLALSGTPVQNHLGELWSLFEFLDPGMLGRASALGLDAGETRNPDPERRELLARAVRPFILRRTKEQVAPDLPLRLEQTLHCEMDADQRAEYDALREHYRRGLLARVARDGVPRSAIQILEALLRLRQAACHPGLIDPSRVGEPSAKLEVLLSRLAEVVAEGHKALVFSQFTSFLAIARDRLDRDGVRYEYLDGRTRDRAARVARFQNDPACGLFLVSLKAGGVGLNLTAADYVFLLDPWWNPAVEAQAIDRTHRIGQTRPVFAYRLIARDTVEEKVLALQEAKRDLADSIISADGSLVSTLTREDLELLLS